MQSMQAHLLLVVLVLSAILSLTGAESDTTDGAFTSVEVDSRSKSWTNWAPLTKYVKSGEASIQVFVQGSSSNVAVLIIPSYGRDGSSDFGMFAQRLVDGGCFVLRPQPRGTLGSSGPLKNVTLDQMAADVASVIDELAGGQAVVLGHAFGHAIARIVAFNYPEKVTAIIAAAAQAQNVPPRIAAAPLIAANLSASVDDRLNALRLAFFAPGHDPTIWLSGWHPDTLAMQRSALAAAGSSDDMIWGTNETQILEIIPALDPFKSMDQWSQLSQMFPGRVNTTVIENASHALFPEQPDEVADVTLSWLSRGFDSSKAFKCG